MDLKSFEVKRLFKFDLGSTVPRETDPTQVDLLGIDSHVGCLILCHAKKQTQYDVENISSHDKRHKNVDCYLMTRDNATLGC